MIGMAKAPPNFTKLFFEFLGGEPAAVRYPLRDGPCLLHDVAFLSSLLHDARVLNPRVKAVDGVLAVRFNRDCWELGLHETSEGSELYVAKATLTCRGVRSVAWELPKDLEDEPWLSHVWVEESWSSYECFGLILRGLAWHCRVVLDAEQWSVVMEDEETPHLWAARHGS